ncbi:MAG: nucleotidyltransferase domain-containing protein [bacterium]
MKPIESLELFIKKREQSSRYEARLLKNYLPAIAKEFKKTFPEIKSLSLIGSFSKGNFAQKSDLDFVVSGLSKEKYLDAWLFFEKRTTRSIHLIRKEEIPSSLIKRMKGRVLYE